MVVRDPFESSAVGYECYRAEELQANFDHLQFFSIHWELHAQVFCCLAFIDTQLLCLQIKLLLTCTMLQDTLISESLQQFTATSGREETLLFEELFHLLRTSSIMVVTALSSSHLCICCASWQACAFSRSAYILDSHHCTYLLVCLIRLKNIFTELHLVHLMILLTPSPLPPIELCLSKASLNGQ